MKLKKKDIKVGALVVVNDEVETQVYFIVHLSEDLNSCLLNYYTSIGKRLVGGGNGFPTSVLKKPSADQLAAHLTRIYKNWGMKS